MRPVQLNVEYWFRLLYECFHGGCFGGTLDTSGLSAFFANLWLWIIYIGYFLAVVALLVIVYGMVRLFELREREEEYYDTVLVPADAEGGANARWDHIETLRDSSEPSDWRSAIIEADIMLDDLLTKQGYEGAGVAEKLKKADPLSFHSLNDAWEAHKVRNQVAHQGSAFQLTADMTRRIIARYENVFREFKIL